MKWTATKRLINVSLFDSLICAMQLMECSCVFSQGCHPPSLFCAKKLGEKTSAQVTDLSVWFTSLDDRIAPAHPSLPHNPTKKNKFLISSPRRSLWLRSSFIRSSFTEASGFKDIWKALIDRFPTRPVIPGPECTVEHCSGRALERRPATRCSAVLHCCAVLTPLHCPAEAALETVSFLPRAVI